MGYVYVIHAENVSGHVTHYVGYTTRTAAARLREHLAGKCATTAVLLQRDYTLHLAHWWQDCSLLDESFLIAHNKQDKIGQWCKHCDNQPRFIPPMGKSDLNRVRVERAAATQYQKLHERDRKHQCAITKPNI